MVWYGEMSLWKWEEITLFKLWRTPLYPSKAEKSWDSYLCKRKSFAALTSSLPALRILSERVTIFSTSEEDISVSTTKMCLSESLWNCFRSLLSSSKTIRLDLMFEINDKGEIELRVNTEPQTKRYNFVAKNPQTSSRLRSNFL